MSQVVRVTGAEELLTLLVVLLVLLVVLVLLPDLL